MELTQERVTFFRPRIKGPELAIEDAVINSLGDLFNRRDCPNWLGGSVPIGAGRPDLVSVRYDPRILTFAEFSPADSHILAYLRTSSRATAESIAERLSYSNKLVNDSIETFERLAIIGRSSHQTVTITSSWREILPEVIAIEAKVSDWRTALQQAIRNGIFAHRSFVALPTSVVARIDHSRGFDLHGIGILEVSESGAVSIFRTARKKNPTVWSYYFHLATVAAKDLVKRAESCCTLSTSMTHDHSLQNSLLSKP